MAASTERPALNPLSTVLGQAFTASDLVAVVLAMFAGVYAFVWRRDRDPGMGWFAWTWAFGAIWFVTEPWQHNNGVHMVISPWSLVLFALFFTLSIGLVDYVAVEPPLHRRLLAIVLAAGAIYWVLPLGIVLFDLQVRRSVSNLPIGIWYASLGGVAFWLRRQTGGYRRYQPRGAPAARHPNCPRRPGR